MLSARTFPVSISSSRGGRCFRILADDTGGRLSAFSVSLPPEFFSRKAIRCLLGCRHGAVSSNSDQGADLRERCRTSPSLSADDE